jgi:hypothetical protein
MQRPENPGPRSRRPARLVSGALVALLIASCGPANPSPPPTANGPASVAQPTSPVLVNLERPGGGTTAHVGYPIELDAAALGLAGIGELELWAGGERVQATAPANDARPAATAHWTWTPTTAGETVLLARAVDAAGRTGQSAPLRIRVVQEPPVEYRLVEVKAKGGEDLATLVGRHGGDATVAAYWNASLPAGPLAAGTTVAVPIREQPAAPPMPSASADGAGAGDGGAIRLVSDTGPKLPTGLAVPDLKVSLDGCTVTARASGATGTTAGLAFSVLPPASTTFAPLPPLAPSEGKATETFAALGGTNYLTVTAYDQAAGVPSAVVPVDVPADCSAPGWGGDVRLEGGVLVGGAAVDRAYLYLKIGDGAWQRVPGTAGSFVKPAGGVLDFGSDLPPLGNAPVSLEAWGWSRNSLTHIGSGSYTPPPKPLYGGAIDLSTARIAGSDTNLDIQVVPSSGTEFPEQLSKHSSVDRPGPNSTSGVKTFKWSSGLSGITQLQWQILPYPLIKSTVPIPPFLIDTGTIDVTGLKTGYFTIDLKPYLSGGTSGVTSATAWGQDQLLSKLSGVSGALPGSTSTPAPNTYLVNPGGLWFPPSPSPKPNSGGVGQLGGTNATLGDAVLDNPSLLTPALTGLYVRVIPYAGTTQVGDPSPTVSFDIVEPSDPLYLDTTPPPPPPTYTDAYTMYAIFYAPTASDPHYYHCVRVAKNGANLGLLGDWSNGTIHCKPEDDGGWSPLDAFESFVDWVGSVWDYISEGASWLEDQVVNVVLAIVPCEAIANEVSDSGKDICKAVAKTALQAVLVSFGIPPEIPNWESVLNAAKGDLKDFILKNASQLPGVSEACGAATAANAADSSFPTCDALIQKAIDEATKQIMSQRSKAAASQAGVSVPFDTILVEPDPRGTPQPPHFDITVTRTNAPLPADVACTVTGKMTSTVASWSWLEYQWSNGDPTIVQKSGKVTGEPFAAVSQSIARLAPGAKASYQLWLTKDNEWFEPDGWNDFYAKQYANWNGEFNHAFELLQKGATVEGSLVSNCLVGGSSVQTLSGDAYK